MPQFWFTWGNSTSCALWIVNSTWQVWPENTNNVVISVVCWHKAGLIHSISLVQAILWILWKRRSLRWQLCARGISFLFPPPSPPFFFFFFLQNLFPHNLKLWSPFALVSPPKSFLYYNSSKGRDMSREVICRVDFGARLDNVAVAGMFTPLPLSSTASRRDFFPFSPNYPWYSNGKIPTHGCFHLRLPMRRSRACARDLPLWAVPVRVSKYSNTAPARWSPCT